MTDMLQGFPYRITSYEPINLADVDPVYGLQQTHPRFLEFVKWVPGSLGPDDGP